MPQHLERKQRLHRLPLLPEKQHEAEQRYAKADRRSVRIKLTPKGEEVAEVIDELYDRHLKSIDKVGGLGDDEFEGLNKALARLERFWVDQILYKL